MIEENKYMDYYEENTMLRFPNIMGAFFSYRLSTFKTSGLITTPYYGETFDANKFQYIVWNQYYIYFPYNIESLGEKYPDLRFVLHFHIDVALYEGSEDIRLQFWDKDGRQAMPEELFLGTGNISRIRKYDVIRDYNAGIDDKKFRRGFKKGDFILIEFGRQLDKTIVENSDEKRHTGFQLSWYYEDSFGKRVDIEPSKFRNNFQYTVFINLVFEAVTKHNVSLQTLWEIAKNYRLGYNHRKVAGKTSHCLAGELIEEDMDYIDYFTSALNISYTHKKENIYKEQINYTFLSDGFQLFHYIARCLDFDFKSHQKYSSYLDIFNNDSTTAILEAAIKMNNINYRHKKKFLWGKNSARNLMKKIHEEFGLSIYKLKVLSSTTDNLENVDDEELRNILEKCLQTENCEELGEILEDQGAKVFLKYPSDRFLTNENFVTHTK